MPHVNPHPQGSYEWFKDTHDEVQAMHDYFALWFCRRKGIEKVMEVGCGKYDFYHKLFAGCAYMGIDVSVQVVEFCNDKYPSGKDRHAWVCMDIADVPKSSKYDLVFSRSVIDHVGDPDKYLVDCIQQASKFTYTMPYRPMDFEAADHSQERGKDGFYYNTLSIRKVWATIKAHADSFALLTVPTGRPADEIQYETHIVTGL